MKLKKFLKLIDMLSHVAIWIADEKEWDEPAFSGTAMDVPWWLTEYYIGREEGDTEEPCYVSYDPNLYEAGRGDAVLVINVIKEKKE